MHLCKIVFLINNNYNSIDYFIYKYYLHLYKLMKTYTFFTVCFIFLKFIYHFIITVFVLLFPFLGCDPPIHTHRFNMHICEDPNPPLCFLVYFAMTLVFFIISHFSFIHSFSQSLSLSLSSLQTPSPFSDSWV